VAKSSHHPSRTYLLCSSLVAGRRWNDQARPGESKSLSEGVTTGSGDEVGDRADIRTLGECELADPSRRGWGQEGERFSGPTIGSSCRTLQQRAVFRRTSRYQDSSHPHHLSVKNGSHSRSLGNLFPPHHRLFHRRFYRLRSTGPP